MTDKTAELAAAAEATLRGMLDSRRKQLASCERMLELLQPEWDKFKARTGHDIYVARDYADHTSAARTHRKEIAALEFALDRPKPAVPADGLREAKPIAWMYDYPGNNDPRFQAYEGMSCEEEDAGMVETPLYAAPRSCCEAERERAISVLQKMEPPKRRWINRSDAITAIRGAC